MRNYKKYGIMQNITGQPGYFNFFPGFMRVFHYKVLQIAYICSL
jgi:hypothetical protein